MLRLRCDRKLTAKNLRPPTWGLSVTSTCQRSSFHHGPLIPILREFRRTMDRCCLRGGVATRIFGRKVRKFPCILAYFCRQLKLSCAPIRRLRRARTAAPCPPPRGSRALFAAAFIGRGRGAPGRPATTGCEGFYPKYSPRSGRKVFAMCSGPCAGRDQPVSMTIARPPTRWQLREVLFSIGQTGPNRGL